MSFDAEVKVGEVRAFADCREPLVAVVLEARGLSGFRIIPVSPLPAAASDRELKVGTRVFQLWNACTASRRFATRSWVADVLPADDLARLREALARLEGMPPMKLGDYERRHLVQGGDFRPWSQRIPVPTSSNRWGVWIWAVAASVVIGLGVVWLLRQQEDKGRQVVKVWTLQMRKPAAEEDLVAVGDELPETPGPMPVVDVTVPHLSPPEMGIPNPEFSSGALVQGGHSTAGVNVAIAPLGRDAVLSGSSGRGMRESEVLKALRNLKAKQRTDGSWGEQPLRDTALVAIALMAHGETATSSEFGRALVNGVRYLTEAKLEGQPRQNVQVVACALCGASVVTRNPNVRSAAERALASIGDNRSVEAGRDWSGLLVDLMPSDGDGRPVREGYGAASIRTGEDAVAETCVFVLRLLKK